MNLIDAIQLYCHIMQQSGGGMVGRKASHDALSARNVSEPVISSIAEAVSPDGHLTAGKGGTFAITQMSAS